MTLGQTGTVRQSAPSLGERRETRKREGGREEGGREGGSDLWTRYPNTAVTALPGHLDFRQYVYQNAKSRCCRRLGKSFCHKLEPCRTPRLSCSSWPRRTARRGSASGVSRPADGRRREPLPRSRASCPAAAPGAPQQARYVRRRRPRARSGRTLRDETRSAPRCFGGVRYVCLERRQTTARRQPASFTTCPPPTAARCQPDPPRPVTSHGRDSANGLRSQPARIVAAVQA